MKYLQQLMIILAAYLLGVVLQVALNLPIPGTVLGLIILFLGLYSGIIKVEMIEDMCNIPYVFFIYSSRCWTYYKLWTIKWKNCGFFACDNNFNNYCLGSYSICCEIFKKGVFKVKEIISSPVFGVLISIAAYLIGCLVKEKLKYSFFNPLLIAIIILIIVMSNLHIEYSDYSKGGEIISFFLAPATVALALPLYKKFSLFKKNAIPILVGIICGSVSGIVTVISLAKLFHLSDDLTISLIPKSITTPIGMALAEQLGGLPSITVVAIIVTGIFGSIIGPFLDKIFKINDKVAMGIAMGNASHAVGTARAMELGETEGAMSSLTIAIAGIITVIIAPPLWNFFSHFIN